MEPTIFIMGLVSSVLAFAGAGIHYLKVRGRDGKKIKSKTSLTSD